MLPFERYSKLPFGPFLPILGHTRIFPKIFFRFCHFFLYLHLYCCVKFRKKLTTRFQEKLIQDVRTANGLTREQE